MIDDELIKYDITDVDALNRGDNAHLAFDNLLLELVCRSITDKICIKCSKYIECNLDGFEDFSVSNVYRPYKDIVNVIGYSRLWYGFLDDGKAYIRISCPNRSSYAYLLRFKVMCKKGRAILSIDSNQTLYVEMVNLRTRKNKRR
jgi:hypothetical protein